MNLTDEELSALKPLNLLTIKPVIYVFQCIGNSTSRKKTKQKLKFKQF